MHHKSHLVGKMLYLSHSIYLSRISPFFKFLHSLYFENGRHGLYVNQACPQANLGINLLSGFLYLSYVLLFHNITDFSVIFSEPTIIRVIPYQVFEVCQSYLETLEFQSKFIFLIFTHFTVSRKHNFSIRKHENFGIFIL